MKIGTTAAAFRAVSVVAVLLAAPLQREEARRAAPPPDLGRDAAGVAVPGEAGPGAENGVAAIDRGSAGASLDARGGLDAEAAEALSQDLATLLRRGRSAEPTDPGFAPAPILPAVVAYRKGDVVALAALAKAEPNADRRLALEWAAVRIDPHPAIAALTAFAAAHPDWPGAGYLRAREEADLLARRAPPAEVAAFFATGPAQSSAGKLALALALRASGKSDEAAAVVRTLWRDGASDAWTEGAILRDFAPVLTKADHKRRADRLLYAETWGAGLRAAALAGPDVERLAAARAAAARGPLPAALVAATPASLRNDPGLLFARVQDARRARRTYDAATLLTLAPADPESLVDPDRWWGERRMVARQLLDLNEPALAFALCAGAATPRESANEVDREFHAGWIALRFLGDAAEAARRFALAAVAAESPLAIARAEYWRGRAAEAHGDGEQATLHYRNAATQPVAYYGQLAAARLGLTRLALRAPARTAEGSERREAVRAADALYAEGLDDLATALAFEAARVWRDEAQIAAMAAVVGRRADAATQVQFGKIAMLRGYAFDAMAFPASGVPAFLPLAHSADLASVYAVARQESEFVWRASSGAGAKGLMQILPSTAASTARRAGVAYDSERLIVDPAFNTQLGAAFLGEVMEDVGGSRELAFAAYNAGPGRVAQWIAAYGDPRSGADLVDWVERIPFEETRDYVQRVSENLAIYRQRFSDERPPAAPLSPRVAKD